MVVEVVVEWWKVVVEVVEVVVEVVEVVVESGGGGGGGGGKWWWRWWWSGGGALLRGGPQGVHNFRVPPPRVEEAPARRSTGVPPILPRGSTTGARGSEGGAE